MLNVPVRNSWSDIATIPANEIDSDILQRILLTHESGLRLIACPLQLEHAESLTSEQVQQTLTLLKHQFDYLVLDLPHDFSATTLAALDSADRIVLVLAPELASIRCAHIALDVFDRLDYPPEKIKLLLNWTFAGKGLAREEIEKAIKRKIDVVFPNTGDVLSSAITKGTPPIYHEPEEAVGILFEDLAYHWSKESHRTGPEPSIPKDSYNRIQERFRARQKRT
jgi:pilus assembly protein CpaE